MHGQAGDGSWKQLKEALIMMCGRHRPQLPVRWDWEMVVPSGTSHLITLSPDEIALLLRTMSVRRN